MLSTLKPRWVMACRPSNQPDNRVARHFAEENTRLPIAPMSSWEADGKLWLEFDVPGLKESDLDISIEDHTLKISGERKFENFLKYFANERRFGKFHREIPLGEGVDPNSIDVTLNDGLLTVTFSPRPEMRPKKIAIKKKK